MHFICIFSSLVTNRLMDERLRHSGRSGDGRWKGKEREREGGREKTHFVKMSKVWGSERRPTEA